MKKTNKISIFFIILTIIFIFSGVYFDCFKSEILHVKLLRLKYSLLLKDFFDESERLAIKDFYEIKLNNINDENFLEGQSHDCYAEIKGRRKIFLKTGDYLKQEYFDKGPVEIIIPDGIIYTNQPMNIKNSIKMIGMGVNSKIIRVVDKYSINGEVKINEDDVAGNILSITSSLSNIYKFEIGDYVTVRSAGYEGWNSLGGVVVGLMNNNKTTYVIKPINKHNNFSQFSKFKKFTINTNPTVLNIEEATNVQICNLEIIIKKEEENTECLCDFMDAGIKIHHSSGVLLKQIFLTNSLGEGLSIQASENVNVYNSKFTKNLSTGIHIGTGSSNVNLISNQIYDNFGSGVDFCANVTWANLFKNSISYNQGSGITGLGAVGDRFNFIGHNEILSNREYGVEVYETGSFIFNNIINSNGRANIKFFGSSFDNFIKENK